MVKSLDDFSSLPSAPGVLYRTFFLFQENTYNVKTTPQISLSTWCKYNIGRIPQHQACWLFELIEDRPRVSKPLRQAQCFCMSIALSNIVTYLIDRQTRLLTDSVMTENSWMLFCAQPELIPVWPSPTFLSLRVLHSVLSCDKRHKDLLANKPERRLTFEQSG